MLVAMSLIRKTKKKERKKENRGRSSGNLCSFRNSPRDLSLMYRSRV